MADRTPCPDCGEPLPDPALIAAAAEQKMILPVHEEAHFCPGPIRLIPLTDA